ncbi:MAG TPA: glycosyltransferase family 2 protein [Nocardioides sp.]|uniref:glycosyltransferase family 2 protein n=1 Tax=Nocardioides sp. TaxID=35761 RepID=UPI002E3813DF|nr:glycosyltransferase family 2 protein [Nocardioides sp.]HEX3929489.1 glycosyltransferase family 2 protein [Nocardioides sp.]
MIISASTVKDTSENVEKFVRRNLLGGIDHLVIFLDAPLPDVEELLDGHPDVTCVRAHGAWWGSTPPGGLNERQITNAALISRLVVGFVWAEWMFMLDGDEVARIDRPVLDALAPQQRAVRLLPLEAASRLHPVADPTLFKRLLSADELQLLHALGVIAEPKQRSYFRGHMSGKPGLRPSADLALGVHHVVDTGTGDRVDTVKDPGLRVLHYESHDGEEFVRKWTALLSSGLDVAQHKKRAPVAASVAALLSLGLPEEQTASLLEELYERTALDDVESLTRLGLLVEVHPDEGPRRPRPPDDEVAQLRELLRRAADVNKRMFKPRARNQRAPALIAKLQRGLR